MGNNPVRPRQLRCLLAVLVLGFFGPAAAGIEDGPRHNGHPEWMEPGLIDLESDLATARAQGKIGVMVLFTTQGCTYCAEFVRASLGDPVLVKRVRVNFVAIGLEMFDDAEMTDHLGNELSVKQFAEQHKAGMAPTLLFFTPDRGLIFRAVGYQAPDRFSRILDYLTGRHFTEVSFREYLATQRAAAPDRTAASMAMRDDPLFEVPPYALARKPFAAAEPLLVIFETPGCAACDAFHRDVLALAEVRELLQQLEVVRLDAWDRETPIIGPDGARTTPADWFASADFSRLPALLYVNESGETVLKTDAVVERQRMLNATGLVLERAYEKGWSYQRFARSRAIRRNLEARSREEAIPADTDSRSEPP